jgi:hypothetical protein
MATTNVYTGASGTLLFTEDNTNKPEGDDAKALLDTKMYDLELTAVGRLTNVELYVQTDLQGYYEIGTRHAVSLHGQNIRISGKVGRAYINGALLFLLLGRGANPNNLKEPYPQPALSMNLILKDPAVPTARSVLNIDGVKFENWAFALPEDDFVMENVSFKALRIRVQDEEGGPPTAVKVPNFPTS